MKIHILILKMAVIISDALLAVSVVLFAAEQTDMGMEFFRMPFTIMLVGIVSAAYAYDRL
ncbi:MAG: hypothetical protein LBC38_02695 [Oscillospiraceae bacterium]|jgi:hypothetical protein|nr:hypothetical protein [Oscillospiraceae bacterium]